MHEIKKKIVLLLYESQKIIKMILSILDHDVQDVRPRHPVVSGKRLILSVIQWLMIKIA